MKNLLMAATVMLCGSLAFSAQEQGSECSARKLTRLDVIQQVASSEALAMQTGPKRDVSKIEVFASSDDGHVSYLNVTFTGSVGNSKPVTLKASLNCDAGDGSGVMELEQQVISKKRK